MRTEANSIQLAKRLLECKHFRWMPGMFGLSDPVDRQGYRCLDAYAGLWVHEDEQFFRGPEDDPYLPDLEDPATVGCLFQLVRDAWADPYAKTTGGERISEDVWKCLAHDGARYQTFRGTTEAAALVAALEGAP